MSGVWICLKKPLSCCSSWKFGDVHEPMENQIRRKNQCTESSRSLSNLRNLLIPSISSSSRSLERSDSIRFDDFGINSLTNRCKCSSGDDESILMVTESSADIVTGRCSSQRCVICHQKVKDLYAFEAHFLSKHSLTKLVTGSFSSKVVELICNTDHHLSMNSDKTLGTILTILKVNNMQKTIAEFENYRESIKIRSNKLQKKHPRCLVDGNEFLGFHGTVLECSLGLNDSSDVCHSDQCGVCWILRHGFTSKAVLKGINTVLMSSTCFNALKRSEMDRAKCKGVAKAVLLCRVIAGRIHKPLKRFEQLSGFSSSFDSVAVNMGSNSSIEELYLFSTKALLPCFVIIFK